MFDLGALLYRRHGGAAAPQRSHATSVPPPARIQLERPGWGGRPTRDTPQPWHCRPFTEAATMGFALYWGLRTTVEITSPDGQTCCFSGDWAAETQNASTLAQLGAGHYGIATHHQLWFPPGWGGLILPHPEWFCCADSQKPAILPGRIEFDFWAAPFFVVARAPRPGERQVLRPGDAFCQVVPVPNHVCYSLAEATGQQDVELERRGRHLRQHYRELSRRLWRTQDGKEFGDCYKQLSRRQRDGQLGWAELLADATPPGDEDAGSV